MASPIMHRHRRDAENKDRLMTWKHFPVSNLYYEDISEHQLKQI
jgi:hypothetical protein